MSTAALHFYPGLHARPANRTTDFPRPPVTLDHENWPALWRQIQARLRGHGYARNTLLLYRQIVRTFSRHVGKPPCQITAGDLNGYLGTLRSTRCTWHWTAMNLSVMRTIFDKLAGLDALSNRRGPRRKQALPEHLDRAEIVRLMDAATCLRDQLIISFIYGCGLKTSELRRLTWGDLDVKCATVRVASRWSRPDRQLPVPMAIRSLLIEGRKRTPAGQAIFANPAGHNAISARRIQVLVRETAQKAGLQKVVLPVTLRHTYAVHLLQDGGTIRQLQENLDHRLLETTARYLDITGLPELLPSTSPPKPPVTPSFWHELTDRFTRKIRGIRLFASSA